MVLKSTPEILSPFARNPIRDRGMASVVARNTWTSSTKAVLLSLTRSRKQDPLGCLDCKRQRIVSLELNPRHPLLGESDQPFGHQADIYTVVVVVL